MQTPFFDVPVNNFKIWLCFSIYFDIIGCVFFTIPIHQNLLIYKIFTLSILLIIIKLNTDFMKDVCTVTEMLSETLSSERYQALDIT